MTSVFVSYSRRDEEAVKQIIKSLTRRGIDVWIDKEDIGTGSRWDMQIEEGITQCDKVLVMLSKASILSQNVGDEWGYALDKSKQIIPVLLEDCDVPMRLASLQRIEFVEDYNTAIDTLTEEIRAESVVVSPVAEKPKARTFKAPRPLLKTLKYALPLLAVTCAGWLGYSSYQITVPNLTGLAPAVAEQVLQANLLTLGEVKTVYSDNPDDDAGKVFQAAPAQTTLFKPVTLYVAKARVAVPDLLGVSEAQARQLLSNQGLEVGRLVVEDADGVEHSVFRQSPAPQTRLRENAVVDLYVVKQKIAVADVMGIAYQQAIEQLEAQNLKVTLVHSVTRWNTDYGNIFHMEPEAGSKVRANFPVKIWVADFGGWVYLREGEEGDVLKTRQGYNLRNAPDSSSRKTVIAQLPKGARVKVLEALDNGWRLVREYDPLQEEEMHALR